MKVKWAEIANAGKFDSELQPEIDRENNQYIDLQKKVEDKLHLYLQAQEFLSWTLATMNKTAENDHPAYPEAGYDDIVLEEYLNGAVIIMNLDQWLNKTTEKKNKIDMALYDPDVAKRQILAFKDFCNENKLDFRRIFIKSANEVPKSITNDGLITFRKKVNSDETKNKIMRQFLNIKYELKPIAPLFASFKSYQFVVNYINDACIQSQFDLYLQTAVGLEEIGTSEDRLKAIGMIRSYSEQKF